MNAAYIKDIGRYTYMKVHRRKSVQYSSSGH
jgi:hypothetical protein